MLLRLDKISLSFGSRPLLDRVSLTLEEGERVALVGRNGEGKSSLLRLLLREAEPDAGSLWVRPGARVAHLAQDIATLSQQTTAQIVTGGLPQQGQALAEYETLTAQGVHSSAQRRRLDELHHELDAGDGWQLEQRVATVSSRLNLDPSARFDELSGGWRRRVLLARALVSQPDLLLLDEPTNHLDIDAIEWLEQFLLDFPGALLFVSHDRTFINRLATRIVELDRGALTETRGNYDDYRRLKAQQLEIEAQHQALFDKKLAQEEAWIRKGVEARRTRNEGRVRALMQLRRERRARLERAGPIQLQTHAADESGTVVFDVEHLGLEFDGRCIIDDFSARIMRGDRIGLVGPNGAGKTSLIKALLGQIESTRGSVRTGSRLEIAYYDQERAQLKLTDSVMQNVAGKNDQVIVNGQPRHVSSYLRDFLFRPEQLHTPASALSGGERNRLLLARLFARPANLLVMDEPTNDLDIDTLELLEEFVSDFPGTLLLVSHDRAFLDDVVTSLLVFEGNGLVREFVGGYSDWMRYRERQQKSTAVSDASSARTPASGRAAPKPRRLSYKDQRELSALPELLERLEAEKHQIEAELADSTLYRGGKDALNERLGRLAAITTQLEGGYARWSELEAQIRPIPYNRRIEPQSSTIGDGWEKRRMKSTSTRRAVLLAAATGAVLISPWSAASNPDDSQRNEDRGPGEEKDVGSVEDLMREHGVLRRILLVYQQSAIKLHAGNSVNLVALNRAARLFRTFGEDHHQRTLEEGFIYPTLRKVRGPASLYPDILTAQHHRGRKITDYILETTARPKLSGRRAATLASTFDSFVLMYQNHAAREDTLVLPAWKQALAESDIDEIGDKFEDIEQQQFGKEGFDATVEEVAAIENILGYGDLTQFTAPMPPSDS